MATRDLPTLISDAVDDPVITPFFLVDLLFEGSPLRLWTGRGDLIVNGQTYTGTGNLLGISSIEETSEIAVRGATLTLTGIPSEVVSLALQTPYQGRVCNIYFGVTSGDESFLLQEDGSQILLEDGVNMLLADGQDVMATGATQIFSGYMDEMNIDEGPEISTIEVKVENKLIDLERARVRRFTSGYQKSIYPGDRGFDFVESIQEKEIVWGRKAGN